MRLIGIALGASAGCLLLASQAVAGPCSTQIDALAQQLAKTDAGMGPTGTVGTGTNMTGQAGSNAVSPSGAPQVPTTPATGAMNEAAQNKATSAGDVQNQNTGQGTAADVASGATPSTTDSSAAAALQRARAYDQAGDQAACMDEVGKAQSAIGAD